MRPRIAEELQLLRETFGKVDQAEADGADWFRIRRYGFPSGWTKDGVQIGSAEVLLKADAAYPTNEPYAFWAPSGLRFNEQVPNNVGEVGNPAFEGQWTQFSWAPDEGTWRPGSTVKSGSNLTDWAKSFAKRLAQGI
jgi:hypothetical protein